MATLINRERAALLLEIQFEQELRRRGQSAAQLARTIGAARSSVSRDLAGGLSRAKLERVEAMADALECDLYNVVLPRDRAARRQKLREVTRLLR